MGKENKAFEKTESEGNQTGPAGKWTKNYVPFKGFPKGSSKSEVSKYRDEYIMNVFIAMNINAITPLQSRYTSKSARGLPCCGKGSYQVDASIVFKSYSCRLE